MRHLSRLLILICLLLAPGVADAQTTALGSGYSLANGELVVPISTSLSNVTLPFTISFDAKMTTAAPTSQASFIITNPSGQHTSGFSFGYFSFANDTYKLQAQLWPSIHNGGGFFCSHSGLLCWRFPYFADGNLHHYCVRWTPSTSYLMVDGITRDQTPITGAYLPTTDPLWVIGDNAPSDWTMFDMRVYTSDIGAAGCVNLANDALIQGVYPTTGPLSTGMAIHLPLNNCTNVSTAYTCNDTSGNGNNASNDAAPTVAITAPTTTGPFNGPLTLTATCTDTSGVLNVQLIVDGTTFTTIASPGPYTASFPTTLVNDSANPHVFSATCTNLASNTATATQNFNTNNGAIAPAAYFVAATGCSDSNAGTSSGSPWCTPNHEVRCGDVLNAAAGNYSGSVGAPGGWGQTWSCPSTAATPVYQAIFKCSGTNIQACNFTNSGGASLLSPSSNWAVIGMHASSTGSFGNCFSTGNLTAGSQLYVAFINNYMDSCDAGADLNEYTAHVGELIYGNAASIAVGGGGCFSALSSFQPANANPSDTGTHMFVAGNFFINNKAHTGSGCVDGEAIILDGWQVNGHYNGQLAVEQNLFIGNGSWAYEVFGNSPTSVTTNTFFFANTTWGNASIYGTGAGQNPSGFAEVVLFFNAGASGQCCNSITNNIMVATGPAASTHSTVYSYTNPQSVLAQPFSGNYVWNLANSALIFENSNTATQISATTTGCGACAINVYANPGLASPALVASKPNCAAYASAYACMVGLGITTNFVPSGGAAAVGYQPPASCTADAFFPVWLAGLKPYMTGLLTIPC